MKNNVSMKQHYLGGIFPGQSFVEIKIEISDDLVMMTRRVDGRIRYQKVWSSLQDMFYIKTKLRASWGRMRASGRWQVETCKGITRAVVYTPSRSWNTGKLSVRWLGLGSL
jgi:hypothetical protein